MSNQIKWNGKDDEPDQELDDADLPKDPPEYVPASNKQEVEEAIDEFVEFNEEDEEAEELNDAEILSNARLRLEQGRLYEMLMINDLFVNLEADPQAIKNVQREIKRFAKERMEVMLGMKKLVVQESQVVNNQFNSLQFEILTTLAAKLSGGASEKQEDSKPSLPPKSKTITPISRGSTRTTKSAIKAVVEAKVNPTKKSIKKEAITEDPMDYLDSKPIEEMTYEEKLEYNKRKAVHYNARKTSNPASIPMPSIESMNAYNAGMAGDLGTIAKNMLSKINGI
jgi:hypothetical protein